jgi:hypothetical protein
VLRLLSPAAAAALGGIAAGAGGGFALAAAVGSFGPPEKAAALARLGSVATTDSNTESTPAPYFEPHPIPAQMLGRDSPVPISPAMLDERNGWLVSDGKTLVAVYAGASGDDSSMGRLVIVRQDLVSGRQWLRVIGSGRTGALTIASAPLGSSVEREAQTGRIRLRSASGRSLTLDLATDRVGNR